MVLLAPADDSCDEADGEAEAGASAEAEGADGVEAGKPILSCSRTIQPVGVSCLCTWTAVMPAQAHDKAAAATAKTYLCLAMCRMTAASLQLKDYIRKATVNFLSTYFWPTQAAADPRVHCYLQYNAL